MSEWISVEDRLPDESVSCLVFGPDGNYVGWVCDPVQKWWAREGDLDDYCVEVTHWMPLPEPPK